LRLNWHRTGRTKMFDLIGNVNEMGELALQFEKRYWLNDHDWSDAIQYHSPSLFEAYSELFADNTPEDIDLGDLKQALIDYAADFQDSLLTCHEHPWRVNGTVSLFHTQEVEFSLTGHPLGKALLRRSNAVLDLDSRYSNVQISSGYGYVSCEMSIAVDLTRVPEPAELMELYK
jgi:hypothetical protein